MSYLVTWGIEGGPIWPQSTFEDRLTDAVEVARVNDGVIFDLNKNGHQLSPSEIEELLHPFRKLAEEIVGSLMAGDFGESAQWIWLVRDEDGAIIGRWSTQKAVVAVEKVLEGSGLS